MSCFNTTFVSVRVCKIIAYFFFLFCFNTTFVSVRGNGKKNASCFIGVSIQPLCRFEALDGLQALQWHHVSIQPLCRFEGGAYMYLGYVAQFQYNLCVGSRKTTTKPKKSLECFNTTFVSVRVNCKFGYFKKCTPFQYNLCVGSSLLHQE